MSLGDIRDSLAQEQANSFAEFVSAYSGLVDVVNTAGEPYSRVAFQTLSVLLIVSFVDLVTTICSPADLTQTLYTERNTSAGR